MADEVQCEGEVPGEGAADGDTERHLWLIMSAEKKRNVWSETFFIDMHELQLQ